MFRSRWATVLLGLLLVFGLGGRSEAQTTTSFMSAANTVNPYVILPSTQCTGTAIFSTATDHFDMWYGAGSIKFITHGTATLSMSLNIGGSVAVNVSVDGAANQALTTGGGMASYAVTLPNGSDHLITVSLPNGAGTHCSFYSITTDTGGTFGNPFGTLPDGTQGFGTVYCTLNAGGTAAQSWLDLGGGAWTTTSSFADNVQANYQYDSSLRVKAKGGSVWLCVSGASNESPTVIVPRVDGVDYAPVTLVTKGGLYEWVKVADAGSVSGFNSTAYHDVIISIVQYGISNLLNVSGIMVGGSGASLQTSAITKLHTIIFMGDSITQGIKFLQSGLYTNSNFPYLIGRTLGVAVANCGVAGTLTTTNYYPPTGYQGTGSDQGSQLLSIDYRTNHTGQACIPSVSTTGTTYDWCVWGPGTNDFSNILNGVQIPLTASSAGAIANANVTSFTTGTGSTTTTVVTSTAFVGANLGERIVGTSGANNTKGGFITAVSGSGPYTLTIEADGGTTWSAASSGDGFAVSGVNFYDQYKRGLLLFLTNASFSTTKVLIWTCFDRTLDNPPGFQTGTTPPATLSQWRAQQIAVYTYLHAIYPARVYLCDMTGVINPTTQSFDGLHPNAAGALLGEAAMLNVISPPNIMRNRAGSRKDITANSFGVSRTIIEQISGEHAYSH
jgi:hypothetical protein